ncbi:hypothetical protein HER10_EVM0012762 [Colletotrichum scovillei]|uniref:uncharacterized protein n=1 Tax=Colletotrichum scovillei TaxID=1209932 RepID=UPI0015C3382F|nr:uncharacterized protein HER10_EVM0012762 [Colletotrichum scovillei]KAF4775638.1 hypothetical protein HER10_EVM0012762 [Colletotrichum scovillei]
MPRRNVDGPVSHAKWPTVDAFRSTSTSSPWDVDDSTAQTVSKLNCVFGFRPPNAYNYTVTLTRNNRAQGQATITCYRQTSLALGGPYAEFFKASEALVLLQHMVNASSMSFVPFSKRERSELMLRMRTSPDAMILGEPCSNARAWTSFFSTELGAGRAWEVGTVIFPWKVLERLMSSLNSEFARKRRVQSRAAAAFNRREAEEHTGPRGGRGSTAFQHSYSHSYDSSPVSLHLAGAEHGNLEAAAAAVAGDRSSVASGSPPPRTPTEILPPKLQLLSEQRTSQIHQSPPPPPALAAVTAAQIRTRRRQHSEPAVRRLSLTPPRISLLKSNNLRRLHASSTPTRLEFYDSIRAWPASSHRARVRLPPCSRFLEMVEDQGVDSHNPIVV